VNRGPRLIDCLQDLVQLLREQGCNNISIGEGTVANKELGSDTCRGYRLSGIKRVAEEYGLKLIDFHKVPCTVGVGASGILQG